MKKNNCSIIVLFFIISTMFTDCAKVKRTANDEFDKLSEEIIADALQWNPVWAVSLGFHEYDGKIADLSRKSLEGELSRLKKFDQQLHSLDTASLSAESYFDYRILRSNIRSSIFQFEDVRVYTRNPITYAGILDLSIYIKRNFAPLENRLRSIINIEKKIPSIFSDARTNLDDSLPRPFIQIAIEIAKGSADFFKNDLVLAFEGIKNDSLMSEFRTANNTAVSELKSFEEYLEKEKLPKAGNNFALGSKKYSKMLLYDEDIVLTPEILLDMGLKELENEQNVFKSLAGIINPHKPAPEVYKDLIKEHPTAADLIPDITKNVGNIRDFLIANKIVEVPPEAKVKVEPTPKFERSTSTASMDTPGPFEKTATDAFYYVTPVDSAWTGKQKEDWLAQFDKYTSNFITIHEVFPGHYVQFCHLKASSATKVEKIFGSYAFVEGWAHYCEKMMIEEGYGNNGDFVVAAKYNLAQSAEALLRLSRFCASIKMHCQGMTVDEATRFFMDNWYQGEKPSYQEAIRGTYDPGYLYYALGKMMMLKLRDDYQKQEGNNYSLEKFHNNVLEHGMPPFELLREKLLKNKNEWKEVL